MALPFFTIGHSTRSVDEFADLLAAAQVGVVVDVRSFPRSRTNPQFNVDSLPAALEVYQVRYLHLAALGGLRGKQSLNAASPNGYWKLKSFRNYADYAMGPVFADGLAQLRRIGQERRAAIMCAEAVWWRCHRRIVADHLLAAGEAVFHILDADKIEPAKMTPGAVVGSGGVTYPVPQN